MNLEFFIRYIHFKNQKMKKTG